MPNVLTVAEAVERAKNDGYPISAYLLRRWIKTGAVPVRMAGRKILIFYPNLISFLECRDGADNAVNSETIPKIRRLEV